VPLLVIITLLASNKTVMGPYTASRSLVMLGWTSTAVMGLAAVWMLVPG
jgi:Mn2+/Fe2+ NRAMP family transporter